MSKLGNKWEVYVLLDEDRVIRYVGCTGNPEQRRESHILSAERSNLDYETFEIFEDEKLAKAAEKNLTKILYILGSHLMNIQNTKSVEKEISVDPRSEFWDKIEKLIREEEDFYFRKIQIILEREKRRPGRLTDEEKSLIDSIMRKFTRF